MAFRSHRLLALLLTATLASGAPAGRASAYLYWTQPNIAGAPVKGDEPGIGLPMPGATPAELQAHLLWNMRSGLNVAALQCQFSPILRTVPNYNNMLSQHAKELTAAYKALSGYFKRTGGKGWQVALDQYTTRTYNGFSTMHAQLSFCDTAATIGREALSRRKGDLHRTAEARMREFRNSLVPVGDPTLVARPLAATRFMLPLDPKCWDKKDRLKRKCETMVAQIPGIPGPASTSAPPAVGAATALPYSL
jgi:hypothetical protein